MAVATRSQRARRRLEVTGTVQGVGFRPFVHELAGRHGLGGRVHNAAAGVQVEVEGRDVALDAFAAALVDEAPPAAHIESVTQVAVAPQGGRGDFRIAASEAGVRSQAIGPDLATCDDCLRELFDPDDRRHRYPFLTCTACGPRFTIVRALPYDRERTTLAGFPLCADCRAEYEDPSDRRFHAEAIACPVCGPRLSSALEDAVCLLRSGGILAVKGLGGWHLVCDAGDEAAVGRLRTRKARDAKAFAVMTAAPDALVELNPEERALLASPARPIVLAARRHAAPVAPDVAPRSPWLGVLLPYTPLHHLLLHDVGRPLVMTSGNRSDEPIAVDDEAHARLGSIADAFLGHDRPIHRRCEDSVVRARHPVRRSRGLAPAPLGLPVPARRALVAAGGQLKSTFCVAQDRRAWMSPHLGDLDTAGARLAFRAELELYLGMLELRPEVVAHDLHPEYASTAWALEQEAELVGVQHHHAHAAACLAEHGVTDAALAVVLDGTGYGPDGTLWGGEVLRFDLREFERVAHLKPVPLPGGEQAIREPWRAAAAYLERADRPVPFERWPLVRKSLGINAPLSSGAGRLLDAVAALLGVCTTVSYEGQAAVELEFLAGVTPAESYTCRRMGDALVGSDLVRAAHDDLADGRPREQIAAATHEGVAAAFAMACAGASGPRTVVLSGGCLQNARIAASLERRLTEEGFSVLTHRRVPPNDGGISYGQAAVAAARKASACA